MKAARVGWQLVQLQLAELLRQRVAWFLAAMVLSLVLLLGELREFDFGAEEARFFVSVTQVALWGAGVLLAALLGPGAVAQTIERRTLAVLIARRVGRGTWVIATLTALGVVLGWLVALTGSTLAAMLAWHGHAAAIAPALLEIARVAGGLITVAAAAMFFGTVFAQPWAGTLATLALAVAGQFAPFLTHNASGEGAPAWVWRLLDWVVPNLNLVAQASGASALVLLAAQVGLFASAAVVVFSGREL
jgi:ABC-type transport system involved in multi-copper enzyme maturation permease subunit